MSDDARPSAETQAPNPACINCAEDSPEEYERVGYRKNPPGRRTEMRCEGCRAKLGAYYRPVSADGGDRPSAGVTQDPKNPVMKRCAETHNKSGKPIDVYKCPFCQRRLTIVAGEDHPVRCPWGCER